jgi:hypothetical protein
VRRVKGIQHLDKVEDLLQGVCEKFLLSKKKKESEGSSGGVGFRIHRRISVGKLLLKFRWTGGTSDLRSS